MTGVVTELLSKQETRPRHVVPEGFEGTLSLCSDRAFVPYRDVMTDLGVPSSVYECSIAKLRNGKRVYLSDPNLGWGPKGFGYYVLTYIGTEN
jgi:hypothetical protein